jgi:predicted alpha/beta-fold hydrolase
VNYEEGEVVEETIAAWRFRPHPLVASGHAQTIAGAFWRRRFSSGVVDAEERSVRVDDETTVVVRCSWQPERRSARTLLLVHGLEGSDASCYMLGTADKAYAAGWNAVRLNIRNCGGTEHLTPTLYHSGMSSDVGAVIRHLVEEERLERVAVVGFSLGGNMVLKMTGEWGEDAPEALEGVAAVSPAIDLSAAAAALERRENLVYHVRFVRSLHGRMRRKDALFPGRYDVSLLEGARTVRDYDTRYIAPLFGFRDAEDYYDRASSLHHLHRIAVPALVLHAADDPFIPLTPRVERAVRENPRIRTHIADRGGHVGFVAASRGGDPDRHWAENRVIEFFSLLDYNRARSPRENPKRVPVPY